MNRATLYAAAMAALAIAQGEPVDCDDIGMATASDADLRDWADDLADRVGLNVDAFRIALEAYIAERNGTQRPTFNPEGLPESMKQRAADKAAASWCYVTPQGATFYVSEAQAHAMFTRNPNGAIFPPQANVGPLA